jgi:hypothetical protein
MQYRKTLLEKYLLQPKHHAIGIGSVGGRRARRMLCVGLDLRLHPHRGLVLVLVLRGMRVREPERGQRAAPRLARGRAMMGMGRRRSSFTSLAVRASADSPVCFMLMASAGYYPPNHQLVIGTDPLDSFEELAELLGQVKPPTASKEDIDNSGLEIIRSGVLAEYEKIGRIAPMCVDRVRVCASYFRRNGADETTVIVPDLFGGL